MIKLDFRTCLQKLKNYKSISYKGTFWKKFPLNPQKPFIIFQHSCKIRESFERAWEFFYKRSLKNYTPEPKTFKRRDGGYYDDLMSANKDCVF